MSSLSSVPDIFIEAPVIIFLLLIRSVRWELIMYVSVSLSITNAASYSVCVPHWALPQCRRRSSAYVTINFGASSRSIIVSSRASGQLRGQAGDPGQPVLTLPNGQLPRGFIPITVSSPSQPPPPQLAPTFSYSTPSAPTNVVVASPRMSPYTDARALYGVPAPDASSSSGRLSLSQFSPCPGDVYHGRIVRHGATCKHFLTAK
jgi:hypothetical protein